MITAHFQKKSFKIFKQNYFLNSLSKKVCLCPILPQLIHFILYMISKIPSLKDNNNQYILYNI